MRASLGALATLARLAASSLAGGVVGFLLVLALVIGGIVYAINEASAHECRKLATVSGMRTAYLGIGSGCYVEVGGRMIPVENWRGEADR